MPNTTSNVVIYATLAARYPVINIASGATSATTLLITAASTGTVVTDVLFRSAEASLARTWEIIMCATGSQATAENARVMISVPALSGNNGSTAIFSLAGSVPSLFDIDLAGNRVITLESGQSIYVKNIATLAGAFFITAKARDY